MQVAVIRRHDRRVCRVYSGRKWVRVLVVGGPGDRIKLPLGLGG